MLNLHAFLVVAVVLMAEVSVSHGFWYYSSSSSASANAPKKLGAPPPPPPPMQQYTLRSETPGMYNPWGPQYQSDSGASVPGVTVALPVAVPFQQQMGSPPSQLEGTLHNVRLVPCLCPVNNLMSKDFEPASQQMPQQQQSAYLSMPQQQTSSAANSP